MKAAAASSNRPDGPAGGNSAPVQNPSDFYIKIPAKYSNSKTSPMTVTIKDGRQVLNIDLTD